MQNELADSERNFKTCSQFHSISPQLHQTHISMRWVRSILKAAFRHRTTSWGLTVHRITFKCWRRIGLERKIQTMKLKIKIAHRFTNRKAGCWMRGSTPTKSSFWSNAHNRPKALSLSSSQRWTPRSTPSFHPPEGQKWAFTSPNLRNNCSRSRLETIKPNWMWRDRMIRWRSK